MVAMMTCIVGVATGMQESQRGQEHCLYAERVLQQGEKTNFECALWAGCNHDLPVLAKT